MHKSKTDDKISKESFSFSKEYSTFALLLKRIKEENIDNNENKKNKKLKLKHFSFF